MFEQSSLGGSKWFRCESVLYATLLQIAYSEQHFITYAIANVSVMYSERNIVYRLILPVRTPHSASTYVKFTVRKTNAPECANGPQDGEEPASIRCML